MTLAKLAAEYRPSMDLEIVHSWAQDVVAAIGLSTTQGVADGWIEWEGGECPVVSDTLVQIQLRDETLEAASQDSDAAENYYWDHRPCDPDNDIIAYRVVTP